MPPSAGRITACDHPIRQLEPTVVALCALTSAAALAWLYLLVGHGSYWRTGHRLPHTALAGGPLPAVVAVIPARNEADILPACLPSLLGQRYDGTFSVVVVDDDSADGTARAAAECGTAAGWSVRAAAEGAALGDRELVVAAARPVPPGWAGKVWAMAEGVRACGADPGYILFTDADIAFRPGALTALVGAAGGRFALLSQMALLRTQTGWERTMVPAFVYFFAQLYPFRRVSLQGSATAAAAGGCMLVSAATLAEAGGLAGIRGARIDDVALGRLLKRHGARCWLGLTTEIWSRRPYDRLADIWDMVARSAYTQLRYSPAALAATLAGLAWLYLLPPAAALTGLAVLGYGGTAGPVLWLLAAGLAGWLMMTVSYVPMLRLYRLSPLRAPSLPLIAGLYAVMTADSARRHRAGRGGEWKGRLG